MPKFTFACSCGAEFSKVLKMGEHPQHPCPECFGEADRVFENFGFGFAVSAKSSPGNTGVSKHDNPTADHAVGSSAETRWGEITEREKVKKKVREQGGGARALIRRQGVEGAKTFVEYEGGTSNLIQGRKDLVKSIRKIGDAGQ